MCLCMYSIIPGFRIGGNTGIKLIYLFHVVRRLFQIILDIIICKRINNILVGKYLFQLSSGGMSGFLLALIPTLRYLHLPEILPGIGAKVIVSIREKGHGHLVRDNDQS